jgi:actin-related protein
MNQYSETNVMHFLFDLLRIKGLYIFQVSVLVAAQSKL